MDNIERFLRSLPLFSSFSETSMKKLLDNSDIKTYPPGEIIIHFGRLGEFLGIIIDGEAGATRTDESGKRQLLGLIKKGEYMGEMSLMTGNPTSADVIAQEECRVIIIPAEIFAVTLAVNSDAVKDISNTINRRLRKEEENESL